MEGKITITNQSGPVAVVEIEGIIGVPEQWQFDEPGERVTTYETFRQTVETLTRLDSPQVVVNIRSTGGNVNDALLIYDALSTLRGRVTTRCFGYVASAATIIAQAASPGCREISSNSLYLIHKSVCAAEGNTGEIQKTLGMLEQTDSRIAEIYAHRSGRPVGEFEELMRENSGNGRWLSPEEVLAAGLADRIIAASSNVTVADTRPVAAMGLPPLPKPADRRWDALLDLMGIRRKAAPVDAIPSSTESVLSLESQTIESMALAQSELSDIHRRQVAELQNRIDRLETMNARLRVGATATLPKEDPSPQEVRRTPNEDAYISDVRRFR